MNKNIFLFLLFTLSNNPILCPPKKMSEVSRDAMREVIVFDYQFDEEAPYYVTKSSLYQGLRKAKRYELLRDFMEYWDNLENHESEDNVPVPLFHNHLLISEWKNLRAAAALGIASHLKCFVVYRKATSLIQGEKKEICFDSESDKLRASGEKTILIIDELDELFKEKPRVINAHLIATALTKLTEFKSKNSAIIALADHTELPDYVTSIFGSTTTDLDEEDPPAGGCIIS